MFVLTSSMSVQVSKNIFEITNKRVGVVQKALKGWDKKLTNRENVYLAYKSMVEQFIKLKRSWKMFILPTQVKKPLL